VLLLRDDTEGSFSVFMVQRSMQSSFMPGAHVFPGGRVDDEDKHNGGLVPLSDGAVVQRFGGHLDAGLGRAHLVAAAREVEEEAGVSGVDLGATFAFSHWITPPIESRRFDTWFLVTKLPEGAVPLHDDYEVVDSRWVDPKVALARYGDGDLLLAPPTYYTLWDLSRFDSVQQVLDDADGRTLPPVQPRFQAIDEQMALLLPGDPLYPSDQPVDGPTRVVMGDGGRWWVVSP